MTEAIVRPATSHHELDRAGLHVGRRMRFEPANTHGCPIPVWLAMPITFQVRQAAARRSQSDPAAPAAPAGSAEASGDAASPFPPLP